MGRERRADMAYAPPNASNIKQDVAEGGIARKLIVHVFHAQRREGGAENEEQPQHPQQRQQEASE